MKPMDTAPRATPRPDDRALRIVAKSVFKELKSAGYTGSEVLAFTNEMLTLVSRDLRDE